MNNGITEYMNEGEGEGEVKVKVERSPGGSRGGFAAWQVPTGRGRLRLRLRLRLSEVPAGRAGDLQHGESRRVEGV